MSAKRSSRNATPLVVALVFIAPLASCVLLVSPDGYGTTCHFNGENTACGACAVAQCQPSINACCSDDGCGTTLSIFETCSSGDPKGCRELVLDEEATAATRHDLASCISSHCRTDCALGSTKSKTKCDVPLFSNGMSCSCTLSDEANDTTCTAAAFKETICCAPAGWPAPALRCSCETLGCDPSGTTGECLCGLFDSASTTHECAGPHCCARFDVCSCGAKPCDPGDTVVPSCNLGIIKCPTGQVRVDTCSIATP